MEIARRPTPDVEVIKDTRPVEVRASLPRGPVQESAARQVIAAFDSATLRTVSPPRRKLSRPAVEVNVAVKVERESAPIQHSLTRPAPSRVVLGRLAPAAEVARVLKTLKPKPAAEPAAAEVKAKRGPSLDVANETKPGEPMLAAAVATSDAAQVADSAPAVQGAALGNAAPRYPYAARVRGVEGDVLLRVVVLPNGKVADVTLRSTSGYALLDRAARDAVRGWRFRPARRAGRTVVGWVDVPVSFRLTD